MFQGEDDSNSSVTENPEAENRPKPERKHGKKRRREDSQNLREGRNDSTEQSITDIQTSRFASLHSTLSTFLVGSGAWIPKIWFLMLMFVDISR